MWWRFVSPLYDECECVQLQCKLQSKREVTTYVSLTPGDTFPQPWEVQLTFMFGCNLVITPEQSPLSISFLLQHSLHRFICYSFFYLHHPLPVFFLIFPPSVHSNPDEQTLLSVYLAVEVHFSVVNSLSLSVLHLLNLHFSLVIWLDPVFTCRRSSYLG